MPTVTKCLLFGFLASCSFGQDTGHLRCQLIPLPDHQVSFQIDGTELTRWRFNPAVRTCFFYPLNGPAGLSLTRMGHPGAPNHDHHRSVWFAHHNVNGKNFWENSKAARIRQSSWLCYQDGEDEAVMAVNLEWRFEDRTLMRQELVASFRPFQPGWTLELQSRFVPRMDSVTLGKTNFGILGIRMAKSLSGHFGGGRLTGADGQQGEKKLFGRPNAWMDYSGPIRKDETNGITCVEHPGNFDFPTRWHVREDGWMGPSLNRDNPMSIRKEAPLIVRQLLWIHGGAVDAERVRALAGDFARRPHWRVEKDPRPHRQFRVVREPDSP